MLMRSCNGGTSSSTTEVKVNLVSILLHNVYSIVANNYRSREISLSLTYIMHALTIIISFGEAYQIYS